MITVSISINGETIYTRTAVNIGRVSSDTGEYVYELDDASYIRHHPNAGAVALAKVMLDTINEVRRRGRND